ncbi:unnamed protein product [Schistosoma curassoni]|uniref:TPP_enzyme_N domain-containing protein n=1 Tax=Schistosoma curassoni TaxID=6186 RepID=A0A183JD30_9TREM|nr:unnamed protein product [Schistosoma curassoni]
MVVGGSRQETMEPGFLLLDTCQQDVPVILREPVLSDGFDPVSPSFTQGVPVILRELVQPDGFDPVSPSFTVRDVATELSKLQCRVT